MLGFSGLDASQNFGFQNGGTMLPRRTALISSVTPAVVQIRSAISEDSRPKSPPVSKGGPSMVDLIRPGAVSVPETVPEKTADWV